MKLKKAIEILQTDIMNPNMVTSSDVRQAEKLSIEALKYFQDDRAYCAKIAKQKLPGETWEVTNEPQ